MVTRVKRYLELVSLNEALEKTLTSFPYIPGVEDVPLSAAAGRVTATPVFTRQSVPPVHLSAMDGIAVKSRDTTGASEQRPVTLQDSLRVNTGNVVSSEYDAVIMIEDVEETDNGHYTIRKAAAPWQHIRPVGEDIGESEMIVPSSHRIRPHEIGALAAYGVTTVPVRSVRAGLIATGSELVPVGTRPEAGQVIESNMQMASACLRDFGATPTYYGIVPDEPDKIRKAVIRATEENDMVIISAGSSKGTRDFTASIIEELGEVFIHGVAIKPARPVIIGTIDGKPVIGTPGYPLAAYTIIREIIGPMMHAYGLQPAVPETIPVVLSTRLDSAGGTDEFVLLSAGRVSNRWVAVPQSRGAGVQMSAVRANAYMKIPARKEGVMAGEEVQATLMAPRSVVAESLLITGSHDPCIDYLGDMLRKHAVTIHPTHTGSMGGVLSLKKDTCHAAPMHLLAEDGTYNTHYLEKYLPDIPLTIICGAEREQGIIAPEPVTFDDLPDKRIINRQKGSGTRILFDHLLKEKGIDPAGITGYEREATTHLAVALAVRSGEVEAGIGVYSAAKALGLSFTPIGTERYELVTRTSTYEDMPEVRKLFDTVASDAFKEILHRLGGYRTEETGIIRRIP
ncbi:molybdopterin biosynthesis protein [Methanogenium organophilum]|uniref:Molybdopterin biosynthesis protein n=1 Tax=Methanogenium organophilum TaxID=2199 RepID=A0A9X9S6W7_METOG|nr:molybdopterin biosynthesis protein [Methanogenium organophilum]WAI01970.1 molybdopterin biosynthesis protein [Methanogenium organophilum]